MISFFFFLILFFYEVSSEMSYPGSEKDCEKELAGCGKEGSVCGIRKDGKGYRLRIFKDECALILYACSVEKQFAYEETPMHYCREAIKQYTEDTNSCTEYDCHLDADDVIACGITESGSGYRVRLFRNKCRMWEYNCRSKVQFNLTHTYICNGLALPPNSNYSDSDYNLDEQRNTVTDNDKLTDGKPNNNKIEDVDKEKSKNNTRRQNMDTNNKDKFDLSWLWHGVHAFITPHQIKIAEDKEYTTISSSDKMEVDELYIKTDSEEAEIAENGDRDFSVKAENFQNNSTGEEKDEIFSTIPSQDLEDVTTEYNLFKNLVVIRGSLKDLNRVNETINRFFKATHVFDLPVKEMPTDFIDENTRRRLVKIAGPIKVYKPWIVIPKNISDDHDHRPTLNSCYHKCPHKCPATYAPVCGVPGKIAREPSIMFQNHCFMDVAQCKMFWENKSPTALSSSYQESSFVFCLGDVMNHMYSFLPLVKTLQHMGRLPKKSSFHYRLTNLKFFNNLLGIKDPRIMG